MRMMLRFTAPVERSNQAIKDSSLKKTLESLMAKLKPEAAYFGPLEGKRAAMIFFDMAESSKSSKFARSYSRAWTRRSSSSPS